MKKYIISIFAALAALVIPVSCSQQLLEIEQKGVLETDAFYANADDAAAESLIAPIYRTLWTGVYGTPLYIGLTTPDGDHLCGGGSYSDGGQTRYSYYNCMTPANGNHTSLYTQIYRAIYWSNMVVEKLANDENSSVKNRVIAEAKFSRALALMMGIQVFGNPPFMPTTDTVDPANGDPNEMWSWIETSLNEAAAVLPSKASKTGQAAIGGRATKEAALAYLGKAQLLHGNYAEASKTLQKVRSSQLYELIPEFSDLWRASSDFCSEYVFEYNNYNDPTTYSTQNDMRCMYLHLRSSFLKIASDGWGTGWGFCPPSKDFVDFMKDHDAVDGGYSSRFNGTLINFKDYQAKTGANGLNVSPWIDNVGWMGMKYYFWADDMIPGSDAGHPRNARYHKNWVFLRYAEVLLDLAEAEALQGNSSGVGLEALNEVRDRAGLPALGSLTMDAVKNERRAELWGENADRLFGLIRWGDAAATLKDVGKYRYEFYAETRSTATDDDADYPVFSSVEEGEASGRKNFIVKYLDPVYGSTAGFKAGKNEVWPFPESECLVNPNLQQHEAWK